MKTFLDCIPCLVRQALDAARRVSPDESLHERIVRDVLQYAAAMDLQPSPPVLAQRIHRRLRQMSGLRDPYRAAKARQTEMGWAMLPELETQLAAAVDPLTAAARMAIAGNVIDLGASPAVTASDIRRTLQSALSAPFKGDADGFRRAVDGARSILYLADNAGELVFDRLLVAQLPHGRVTVAVRGAPVINDATLADARAAGLNEMATLIDNGSDAPGTLLDDCTPAFRERFDQADLVIAKGQGNYESLNGENKPIYYLLTVKCPVIAQRVGQPPGTQLLMPSRRMGSRSTIPTSTGDEP